MKRTISFIIAVMMLAACFAFTGCAKEEEAATIKIGMQGPYTGSTAVYGLAVQTGGAKHQRLLRFSAGFQKGRNYGSGTEVDNDIVFFGYIGKSGVHGIA